MSQGLRSFPLVLDNGQRAELLATSRFLDDSAERIVRFSDGREIRVPAELISVDKDGIFYLRSAGGSEAPPEASLSSEKEKTVIPVVEEEIEIHKQELQTGRILIHKKVDTREIPVEEVLRTSDVEIERVPMDRVVTEPVESRYEGDTLVIPILEEVLVIEKRLVLREEIRVTRRVQEHTERKTVPVRSEHVEIERTR